MSPKVSILALCYNHGLFLDEALRSIENLTYDNLEVWIADDCSTDNSRKILLKWKEKHPEWTVIFHNTNKGNCITFNELLSNCSGEFVIDFATDDVFENESFESWVNQLASRSECGFCYADAWVFESDLNNRVLHSQNKSKTDFPEGWILPSLFSPSFICPPAVLFRKSALLEIGGYDESLAYEDWDVWLRLARKFPVCRFPFPVINYRKHADSMSASILSKRNEKHLASTLTILTRVLDWEEMTGKTEWITFARYHLKLCSLLQRIDLADSFYQLLKKHKEARFMDAIIRFVGRLPIPIYWIYSRLKRND